MAQTKYGAKLIAAKKIGISIERYNYLISIGLKWCYKCRKWLEISRYGIDNSRYDKLSSKCITCSRVSKLKEMILMRPSIKQGNRASEAVRQAIKRGILSQVTFQFCICGSQARHYHHYKGYAEENFLDVIPMCISCHRKEHWDG